MSILHPFYPGQHFESARRNYIHAVDRPVGMTWHLRPYKRSDARRQHISNDIHKNMAILLDIAMSCPMICHVSRNVQ